MEDNRKNCCKLPENLIPHQERPDLVIRKCTICGARHFEVTLEAGQLGLKGSQVG